ncbi:MAG: hypothetical protein WAO78_16275 [Roseovarius sp.]
MSAAGPRPGARTHIIDRWNVTFVIEFSDGDRVDRVWRYLDNGDLRPADGVTTKQLFFELSEARMLADRDGYDLPKPDDFIWPSSEPDAAPDPVELSSLDPVEQLRAVIERGVADDWVTGNDTDGFRSKKTMAEVAQLLPCLKHLEDQRSGLKRLGKKTPMSIIWPGTK